MKSKTFIFIGRSGCGKGTQLKLLKNFIEQKDSSISCKSVIMGDIFRSFFKEEGYIQGIARDISVNQGKFQPDFLTNTLFVSNTMNIIDENSYLFFDGYPRTVDQSNIIKALLLFAKRQNAVIINIEVSRGSVKERMLSRGREDDNEKAIESRLNEYESIVIPMIEKIKKDSFFNYVEIDGEPSVEEIHKDIISKLGI